jgi:hypothetical protein
LHHESVFLLSLQYDLTDTMIQLCCLCTMILLPLQYDSMIVLSLQYDSMIPLSLYHDFIVSLFLHHDSTILLYLHNWLHDSAVFAPWFRDFTVFVPWFHNVAVCVLMIPSPCLSLCALDKLKSSSYITWGQFHVASHTK